MTQKPDLNSVATIIEQAGRKGALPFFRQLEREQISQKTHPGDLVTMADELVEQILEKELQALVPGSFVLGEENATKHPELIKNLADAPSSWIIDPIDGTINFAHGVALFAVMVAYVEKGQVRMAWIHDPVTQKTLMAEEGAGAWADGQKLRTSLPQSLGHMSGTVSLRFGPRDEAAQLAYRLDRIASMMYLRSAGQEYMALAQGQIDFCLYRFIKPWDHAPASLIIREAGGVCRWLDGRDYRPSDEPGAGLLSAANLEAWQWVRDGFING